MLGGHLVGCSVKTHTDPGRSLAIEETLQHVLAHAARETGEEHVAMIIRPSSSQTSTRSACKGE